MSTTRTAHDEEVVLLDDEFGPIGVAAKASVHTTQTPLHLAFSLYLFDSLGRFLLTRRALTKKTWPGVWTNSCCGHPAPGEDLPDAVRRRAVQELGVEIGSLVSTLPHFRYRAVDASGVVENEFCPVFAGRVATDVTPDPIEVMEHAWVDWAGMKTIADRAPALLSPWCVEQIADLDTDLPLRVRNE